ncbi:hypothetical protein C491_19892 [Natronococcus amylolyticus DSM 10524]|uniref:Uncharacterized protein n=1 Tax=Natronococcus amylolyticus DSM 10524 TaxID=1227497 RepID=L9WXG0_9EURY|nr:hypothetical protein [Natronococcus amylolyticus]ELY54092.1 hypothetical protein C491_19892 [Natronococcus amylolyticus DSM 10524]
MSVVDEHVRSLASEHVLESRADGAETDDRWRARRDAPSQRAPDPTGTVNPKRIVLMPGEG